MVKKNVNTWLRLALVGVSVFAGAACTHEQGKEYVFKSKPMGHGPDEYEIYTDRTPRSVHKGEDTGRAGVVFLPPVQPVIRSEERQKEVMTALAQFNEKMYNLDERRAKESVRWLSTFAQEHRGLPPDQPVAIQAAMDSLVRSRERAAEHMAKSENELEKEKIAEALTKADEEIAFFRSYVEQRPAKAALYKRHMEDLEAANKRMQMWQSRLSRMSNTIEWTRMNKGSADAELNRALLELADTLTDPDDQTKLEILAMAVNIGGGDAQALLPRVKLLAQDTTINPEVRAFAAKAQAAIEARAS